ncbi:MAG: YheC/YheD family protein [Alicyclobacillaceae bacterium]|nr:YheC/YheD family protein [Alicyclobacillaceae bacterium]
MTRQRRVRMGLYADAVESKTRPFGEQTSMFGDLARLGRTMGVEVVVLVPGYARSRIGWTWTGPSSNHWEKCSVPLPDVVLRRSGAFRSASQSVVVRDLALFQRTGLLHTLPRRCSNKWYFYQWVQSRRDLGVHMPESALAKGADDVARFLRRQRDIYLKPVTGAQGVSVYRLRTAVDGIVATWDERVPSHRGQRSPAAVQAAVQPVARTAERRLAGGADLRAFWASTGLYQAVLQETVELPRTREGCPFDLRWLIQFADRAQVVARVARVGRPDAVTTNIHTGAQAVDAADLIQSLPGWHPEKVLEALDRVALRVANALAAEFGRYAEVGIDLAVRTDGTPVLFEVNPTPGRRMLRALPGNVREISLRRLLEYAIKATSLKA